MERVLIHLNQIFFLLKAENHVLDKFRELEARFKLITETCVRAIEEHNLQDLVRLEHMFLEMSLALNEHINEFPANSNKIEEKPQFFQGRIENLRILAGMSAHSAMVNVWRKIQTKNGKEDYIVILKYLLRKDHEVLKSIATRELGIYRRVGIKTIRELEKFGFIVTRRGGNYCYLSISELVRWFLEAEFLIAVYQ